MSCQRCESDRVANFGGKCSDMFNLQIGDKEHDGYVLGDFGIGGGRLHGDGTLPRLWTDAGGLPLARDSS